VEEIEDGEAILATSTSSKITSRYFNPYSRTFHWFSFRGRSDETSNSSTSILGLATTIGDHKFILGNFYRSDLHAVTLDPAIVIKPKFDGTVIKFGEISCSLSIVNNLVKFDPVNLDSAKSTENR
jgi:hypothetical protein